MIILVKVWVLSSGNVQWIHVGFYSTPQDRECGV